MIDELIKKYEEKIVKLEKSKAHYNRNGYSVMELQCEQDIEKYSEIIKDLKELQEQQDNEIIPFDWSEEVLSGKHKVVVSLPSETVRGDIDV